MASGFRREFLHVRSQDRLVTHIHPQKLPLYLHTVMHIIRSMGADGFSYTGTSKLYNNFV